MKTLIIGRASRILNPSNYFMSSSKFETLTANDLYEFDQIIFASYAQKLDAKHLKLVKISNWLNLIWHKRLIFLSSDHVFSGNRGLYSVSDLPDPKSAYGISKIRIEKNLSRFCILRFTTYGPTQSNRPLLVEIIKQKRDITLFPNQYFSPVGTEEINKFCSQEGKLPKLVHLSGPRVSKADLILSNIKDKFNYKFKYDYSESDHSLIEGIKI